jgi:hypothetical protein
MSLKALVTERDLDLLDGGVAFMGETGKGPSKIMGSDVVESGFSGVFLDRFEDALGCHAFPTQPVAFVYGPKYPASPEARRLGPSVYGSFGPRRHWN